MKRRIFLRLTTLLFSLWLIGYPSRAVLAADHPGRAARAAGREAERQCLDDGGKKKECHKERRQAVQEARRRSGKEDNAPEPLPAAAAPPMR